MNWKPNDKIMICIEPQRDSLLGTIAEIESKMEDLQIEISKLKYMLNAKEETEKKELSEPVNMEQREGNKERLEKALMNYVETSLKEPSKRSATEFGAVPSLAHALMKFWGIN